MAFGKWMRFSEVPEVVRGAAGLYEIRFGRCKLKVGIAGDLSRRLKQHGESLQRRLRGPGSGPWGDPALVVSKGSILAKHLYFDRSIAPVLDLRTEKGRRAFLAKCWVRFEILPSRDAARRRERVLEESGLYRYCGRVRVL